MDLDYGGILTDAFGTGRRGNITLRAQSARIVNGGIIASTTYQTAPAGNMDIEIAGQLYVAGWSPPIQSMSVGRIWEAHPSMIRSGTSGGSGRGSMVNIRAGEIILTEDGRIGADSNKNAINGVSSTGDAGEIRIQANAIQLTNGGNITTSAERAGGGGLYMSVTDRLYLNRGQVMTSVTSGQGSGGNIAVENPQFVVLNQAQIKAQADKGHGGNIRIVAKNFLKTPDSLLSASSKLGIDGEIIIESPEETLGDNLFSLSTTFIDVSRLLPQPCGKKSFETEVNRSKFVLYFLAGSALSPHDFQPSPGFIGQTTNSAHPTASIRQNTALPLAFLTNCHP